MAELLNSQELNQEKTPTKLISECFVKPMQEVEAAKRPYYLSACEILSMNLDPHQKGLLYALQNSIETNSSETISHLLDNLKHSLAIALVHFYPLAGQFTTLKYPEENTSIIFIDCTKGPGARFIHASALDFSIFDIMSSTDVPTIVQSFFDLGEKSINYDGHTRPLLSVQVTELKDGVFIGFTMNHSVGDGTSFIHFVEMLSETFSSNKLIDGDDSSNAIANISRVPIFQYYAPCINDVYGTGKIAIFKLPHLDPGELIERGNEPGPLRVRIFHFSATSLATLKAKANQEYGTHNVISSFQALVALLWRSITKARNISSEKQTTCSIVVNARGRIDPPISDDHFGHLISSTKGICNVKEMMDHDLGWTSMVLHKAVNTQDAKAVQNFYKAKFEKPMMVQHDLASNDYGSNNVLVGGSSRFDMYGPEFGLGRALAVHTGSANKRDGKVNLGPRREGGGVEVEICLRPHIMAALEIDSVFTSFLSQG